MVTIDIVYVFIFSFYFFIVYLPPKIYTYDK